VYDKECVELDGMLIALSEMIQDKDVMTEGICLLTQIENPDVRMLALATFIHKNELIEILTIPADPARHSERMKEFYLQLPVPKTLQNFLGEKDFRNLIFTTIDLLRNTQVESCVLLYDTVDEPGQTLETLIDLQATDHLQNLKLQSLTATDSKVDLARD